MARRKRKGPKDKVEKPQKAAKVSKLATETVNSLVEAANSDCAMSSKGDSSDSESNWEEVEDAKELLLDSDSDKEPIIPKEGVLITIEASKETTKRKRKTFDLDEYFKKQFRKMRREVQEEMHKVHLLCLVAHGLYVNRSVERDDVLRGFALSVIPMKFLNRTEFDLDELKRITAWSRDTFSILARNDSESVFTVEKLQFAFENKSVSCEFQLVLLVLIIFRTLRLETRLISSLHPVLLRVSNEPKEKTVKESDEKASKGSEPVTIVSKCKKTKPKNVRTVKKVTTAKVLPKRRSLRRNASRKSLKESDDSDSDNDVTETGDSKSNSDVDFEVSDSANSVGTSKVHDTQTNDDRNEMKNDHWIEVYLVTENRWVCVDCVNGIIDRPHEIEKFSTQPLRYVIAIDGKGYVKDVTKRYASRWLSHTRKLRVDSDWWNDTLDPFRNPIISKEEQSEDRLLDKDLEERPLPTTISEYKSHPLYALKRHLLKFEGIYPSDAVPVGFIRGEPVYPRHCIRNLHSRETWLKEARLVKIGETPYKVVKARPKWNKAMGEIESDLPLELFGEWQTVDYIPPIAQNGKVPRNDYGNVELFKPTMLPIGTIHLQIPGLNRVARKLEIDCAPAMIGWDFHGVGSHPIFDGWIVCEEFKDVLMDAWNEDQVLIENREKEKREKRIYGNWRRLIRGVLIRERINIKYGLVDEPSTSKDEKQTTKRKKKDKF